MARSSKRVSLRDVAEHAGVSISSASIILNRTGNYIYMSEKTKDRVETVAAELGYQPNYAAKALREKATMQIGLVIPNILNSFMQPLVLEASRAIRERGYSTILYDMTDVTDEQKRSTLISIQQKGNVDGLIIHGFGEIVYDVIKDLPTVYIDTRSCVPSICYSEIKACYDIVELLFRQKLSSLAFVNGDVQRESFALREVGFRKAHEDYLVPLDEQNIGYFPISMSGGVMALEWALSLKKRPEAVILLSDIMTYGFMLAARRNGIRIPEDFAVASVDDLEMSAMFLPSITCSRIDIAKMSRLAVETLFTCMETGKVISNQTVPTQLMVRESSEKYG